MPTPVSLERFVGPPIHSHGRGEISIHEGEFSPQLVVPPHMHDVVVVSLMLSGVAIEQVHDGPRNLQRQDLIVTPAWEVHSYRFPEPGRWFNMQLSDAWLTRASDGNPLECRASEIVRSAAAAAWATRVRTEVREGDSVSSIAIDGAMMLMVADMTRSRMDADRRRPRWLNAVDEAIEASIDAPPSVDELAALAGVHPTRLLRTFRHYHRTTISNFVRQRRIEAARAQIATGKPLSVIAVDAGFADQSHFNRVFKKAFGETPGEYARSMRAGSR
ncbi:MAG TPA: AraC family transcriptional regulator [Gemmatimonadaceae bacterium]|nr:AraC family transcriptional regulator [Gemmatimonadaceae bacterium]